MSVKLTDHYELRIGFVNTKKFRIKSYLNTSAVWIDFNCWITQRQAANVPDLPAPATQCTSTLVGVSPSLARNWSINDDNLNTELRDDGTGWWAGQLVNWTCFTRRTGSDGLKHFVSISTGHFLN